MRTNQPIKNYWIRANPNIGTQGFAGGINSAILRYWGAPNIDPTTTSTISAPLVETNLHPYSTPAAPGVPTLGAADVNLNLNIVFDFASLKFQVNGAPFSEAPVPVLLQILSGASTAASLLPAGSVYVLPPNKVIEISMPGGSIGSPVSQICLELLQMLTCVTYTASHPFARGEIFCLSPCRAVASNDPMRS